MIEVTFYRAKNSNHFSLCFEPGITQAQSDALDQACKQYGHLVDRGEGITLQMMIERIKGQPQSPERDQLVETLASIFHNQPYR